MASPFSLKKKARKEERKFAEKASQWAQQHEMAGDKPAFAIGGMRTLAKQCLQMAQIRRKKFSRPSTSR
jgi:hypothetical protein